MAVQQKESRAPFGLILPRSATEPRSHCRMCGSYFPADKQTQFVRHVKACAKRHADQLEERVAMSRHSLFRSPADPELEAHLRAGGN